GVGTGGGGGGGGTLVHASRVNATDALAFNPSSVTIPAGDTIYFTIGSVTHNVVFDTQGAPANVGDASSTTEKRRFPTAGTFNYHCSLHGTATTGMRGTVIVQ
ncbi:MAG TPA: plastocyanin/azurin family copper-binding protein, partial [Gemmatimonadaceae bacterium]|nr:plastocyanin/azurin family copper-binding protein [Gemmatimonadaceae bacterium]